MENGNWKREKRKTPPAAVSSSVLPGILLDRLAAFCDSLRHFIEVRGRNGAGKTQKFSTRNARGFAKLARKIQHLALLRRWQALNLLNNLVFQRFGHGRFNLGKLGFDVKGQAPRSKDLLLVRRSEREILQELVEAEEFAA